MPEIFVRGPSINPSFGTPVQFLNQITSVAQNRRQARLKSQQLEETKLFRDATLEANERKQDFVEGAGARKVAETAALRGLQNERALAQQAAIDDAGFGKVQSFLANPETQKLFATDPRYKDNPEAQLELATSLAQANKREFTDVVQGPDNVRRKILSGGGTQAEADTAGAALLSGRGFNPLSPDLAKALFQKIPANNLNVTNLSRLAGGTGRSGGGSTTPLVGIAGESNQETLNKEFFEAFEIEKTRFEFPGTDARITDPGDLDLVEADVRQLQGEFATELRPSTVLKALGSIADPTDGTVKIDIRNMNADQRSKFLILGQGIEAKANESRGSAATATNGNISLAGLQALQKQQRDSITKFNSDILSRTAPRTASFETRLGILRNALGIPQNQTASGAGTGGQTPPPVTPPPGGGTGSNTLDGLISGAADTPAANTPAAAVIPEAAPEGFIERSAKAIPRNFNKLLETGFEKTAQPLVQKILDSTIGETNLKPTAKGRSIARAETRAEEKRFDVTTDFSGTGTAREEFEEGLSFSQQLAYQKALDPDTPKEEAIRIMKLLRQGKTPGL